MYVYIANLILQSIQRMEILPIVLHKQYLPWAIFIYDNCHLKYHEYRDIVCNSTANTEIINITTNVLVF